MYWKKIEEKYPIAITAGEALAAFDAVAIASDGLLYCAESDVSGQMPSIGILEMDAASGDKCSVVSKGLIGSYTTGMTPGTLYYIGATGTTGNTITSSAPATTQVIGVAVTATDLEINLKAVHTALTAGAVSATYLAADAVETAKVDDDAITAAKLNNNQLIRHARSRLFDLDDGDVTTDVILMPSTGIEIIGVYFVATVNYARTAGAVKLGTAAGGAEILTATDLESKNAGAAQDLSANIAEGTVSAGGAIHVTLTAETPTVPGEGYFQIEYTMADAT